MRPVENKLILGMVESSSAICAGRAGICIVGKSRKQTSRSKNGDPVKAPNPPGHATILIVPLLETPSNHPRDDTFYLILYLPHRFYSFSLPVSFYPSIILDTSSVQPVV